MGGADVTKKDEAAIRNLLAFDGPCDAQVLYLRQAGRELLKEVERLRAELAIGEEEK